MSNGIGEMLLGDAQQAHLKLLKDSEAGALHRAFLEWLLPARFAGAAPDDHIEAACAKRGGSRSYRDVALLGFMSGRIAAAGKAADWEGLLEWLIGTKVRCSGELDPIVDDPAGLLGVALAVEAASADLKARGSVWLAEVCKEAVSGSSKESHVSLCRAVSLMIGGETHLGGVAVDVAVALQSKGLLTIEPGQYAAAFTSAKMAADEGDVFTAAVRLAALDWIQSQAGISIERPDVTQARRVLDGVQSSLYRWVWEDKPRTSRQGAQARRWHIENEYHFQSLLYAILRPIFPDLKEEEYTASVGTTQPRADLYIPSLKMVVEVKFWYQRDRSGKLLNELGADASLYRAKGSAVQVVLPVIWDDGRRSEEHSVIQDGIGALDGLEQAVFVMRPSTW